MIGILYKISNSINDKVYIGKTYKSSVENRLKEHISDSKRYPHRPLYEAMNFLGTDNFYIEELGKFEPILLEKKEVQYINMYNSFLEGYNATRGGEGTPRLDLDSTEITNKYLELKSLKKTAIYFGAHEDTIRPKINVPIERNTNKRGIYCISLDRSFDSITTCARFLLDYDFCESDIESIRNVLSRKLNKYGFSLRAIVFLKKLPA